MILCSYNIVYLVHLASVWRQVHTGISSAFTSMLHQDLFVNSWCTELLVKEQERADICCAAWAESLILQISVFLPLQSTDLCDHLPIVFVRKQTLRLPTPICTWKIEMRNSTQMSQIVCFRLRMLRCGRVLSKSSIKTYHKIFSTQFVDLMLPMKTKKKNKTTKKSQPANQPKIHSTF